LTPSSASYFDVANLHYFSSQAPTWSTYGTDIAGKVGSLRQVMAHHQVVKPVAVTELSWTSSPIGASNLQSQQASYVAKVLSRGLNLDLYAMIWFSLYDYSGADYPYGLLDVNL